MARQDVKGVETLDDTPIAVPAGFVKPPTIQEMCERYLGAAMRRAQAQGFETLEEAEDFEMDDGFEFNSDHELVFDPVLGKEISKPEKAYVDRIRAEADQVVSAKKKAAVEAAKKRKAKEARRKEFERDKESDKDSSEDDR